MKTLHVWVGRAWKNQAVLHAYAQLVNQVSEGREVEFLLVGAGGNFAAEGHRVVYHSGYISALFHLLKIRRGEVLAYSAFSALAMSVIGLRTSFWVQGAVPQESYLRNRSIPRALTLLLLEAIAMSAAKRIIYVSSYMKAYYEKCYPWIGGRGLIQLCTSDLTFDGGPKIRGSYCYIGGLSKWQRFDDVLRAFVKIRQSKPGAKLYIATRDLSAAKSSVKDVVPADHWDAVEVNSLSARQEVQSFLSKMEYGFLLRDDILVNNVASPIKLAEYLSCDVRVVTTEAVRSFTGLLRECGAGVIADDSFGDEFIAEVVSEPEPRAALRAYGRIYLSGGADAFQQEAISSSASPLRNGQILGEGNE